MSEADRSTEGTSDPSLPQSTEQTDQAARIEGLQGKFADLIEQAQEGNLSPVILELASHPDLLAEQALWNVLRIKAGEKVPAEYLVLLANIRDAQCPQGCDPGMMERLRVEAAVRLGGQLRRSENSAVCDDGIVMLDSAIEGFPADTEERWQHRLLGTAHYERAMAAVKKEDFAAARDHFAKSIDLSERAEHITGSFQAQEAQAFHVTAKEGDAQGARMVLAAVVQRTTEALQTEQDKLRIIELQNTQVNAAVNWIMAYGTGRSTRRKYLCSSSSRN